MICGTRRTTIPSLGAAIETAYVLDVTHRIHAYRLTGIVDDSALHRPVFPEEAKVGERTALSILLGGAQRLRVGSERWDLVGGDGYEIPAGSAIGWRLEGDAWGITLAAPYAVPEVRRFRAPDVHTLRDAVLPLFAELEGAAAERTHRDLLDALSALQSRADPIPTSACSVDEQALARVIDRRLSDLAGEPMQVELEDELGLAERTVRRLTQNMFERYGFVDSNWVQARTRRRLTAAVAFMSNPAATVAVVARGVGYRSSQAMARAFGRAGYPSPARVRATLESLVSL